VWRWQRCCAVALQQQQTLAPTTLPPPTQAKNAVLQNDVAKTHTNNRLSTELDLVHEKKVIVFVNTKRQCDNVYVQLEEAGYSCTMLHGGRNQDQREVRVE
jgi:superfamily II DNA/RNA helicase